MMRKKRKVSSRGEKQKVYLDCWKVIFIVFRIEELTMSIGGEEGDLLKVQSVLFVVSRRIMRIVTRKSMLELIVG